MSHANSLNVEHWNNFDEHVDGLYTHPDKWCGKKVMEHNSYSNADLLWEENNTNMSHQLRSIFLMFLKSFSSIKSFKFTSETEAKLSAILSLSLSRQKFWEHHTYDGLTYLADCLFFFVCLVSCVYLVNLTRYCILIECSRPIRFFIWRLMFIYDIVFTVE